MDSIYENTMESTRHVYARPGGIEMNIRRAPESAGLSTSQQSQREEIVNVGANYNKEKEFSSTPSRFNAVIIALFATLLILSLAISVASLIYSTQDNRNLLGELSVQFLNLSKETQTLQQKINEIQVNQEKLEFIESNVTILQAMVNLRTQVTVECEDGFVYREKCYFANIYPTARIQFQHKESNCSAKGGKVGSILNLEHQILAENYVRPRIPGSSTHTWMWLATIYSNSTETFITPEGHSFPSTSIRWSSNDPKSDSTKTIMLLDVKVDKTSKYNGVYNLHVSPTATTPGVFCEK